MTLRAIGRYQIVSPLGAGGMATVYLAHDPTLDRRVAIKIPNVDRLSADGLARFNREAKAVARLEHQAIVPLYDYGDHDGRPYLVMRYLPGGSLADRLERRAFQLNEALGIIERIASALDYAHRQGILHRDVKPGNILFDDAGAAYLSDFGIARIMNLSGEASLTQTGLAIGTAAYMSPEQALGQMVDGRSDIYSLGVVIFEMLAGDVPYKSDSSLQQALLHINAPIPSIQERRRDLPPATQTAVSRALAKQPKDRYPTGEALALDFRRVTGGARPAAAQGLPAWVWLVGLMGLVVAAFFLFSQPDPPVPAPAAAPEVALSPTTAPTLSGVAVAPTGPTSTLVLTPADTAMPGRIATAAASATSPPVNTATAVVTATNRPLVDPATGAAELPFFMTRLVTAADLEGLSEWELDVMRNEIFARYGRGFNRVDLQAHFDAQPWYTRRYHPEDFPTDRLLTDIQESNAGFILTYQEQNQ